MRTFTTRGERLVAWIGFAASIICLVILGTSASQAQGSELIIYGDGLAVGWQNWSWDSTINFSNGNPVQTGSASIAVTYTAAWAGFFVHAPANIDSTAYDRLQFWVHGGSSGNHQLQVKLADGSGSFGSGVDVMTQANTWTEVEIDLNDLGNPAAISGVVWQDTSNGVQPIFYLDAIRLINSGQPPTATPPPTGGPALTVNAAAAGYPISPYIYGMNFAPSQLAADLQLPVNRWGGNATTRYNWQNDTSSRASDWYFENIPNDNPNPGNLPNDSSSDKFVEQNNASNTETLMTVPLIGWTPKTRDYACGFSVSKYGTQQSVDPYRPDCGNGIQSGNPITGNDPLDTSIAINEAFVQAWLTHLIGRYGAANAGGVRFYNLDNEPMLWNSTHRDVHPNPTSYDEMKNRTYQYAAAVKATDPAAQTVGPALWGWTAYLYSALDVAAGGDWWNTRPDRMAHGDIPFVEWYLQQMKAYEQTNGVRILDYFDLHYYPQASGVALSSAGNAATQALRLRSTRSLWDPTYSDESWIGEVVQLLPRMHDWVDTNYPGTKLAMTEYNWGALDHINGALTQADVLGIFGRERLDLATLWAPPDFDDPGAFAFRMYRNYDGNGSTFGETSLLATSADQAKLAIYAARRSSDNALTVMIINKSNENLTSQVSVVGFAPGSAELYRYSEADLTQIVRLANPTAGVSWSLDFPARSISLLVLKGQPASLDESIYLPVILH